MAIITEINTIKPSLAHTNTNSTNFHRRWEIEGFYEAAHINRNRSSARQLGWTKLPLFRWSLPHNSFAPSGRMVSLPIHFPRALS